MDLFNELRVKFVSCQQKYLFETCCTYCSFDASDAYSVLEHHRSRKKGVPHSSLKLQRKERDAASTLIAPHPPHTC